MKSPILTIQNYSIDFSKLNIVYSPSTGKIREEASADGTYQINNRNLRSGLWIDRVEEKKSRDERGGEEREKRLLDSHFFHLTKDLNLPFSLYCRTWPKNINPSLFLTVSPTSPEYGEKRFFRSYAQRNQDYSRNDFYLRDTDNNQSNFTRDNGEIVFKKFVECYRNEEGKWKNEASN